jgi:ribosomal protein S1
VTFESKGVVIEGFIHISEVSWDKVDDLSGIFSSGQKVDAVIARFDNEGKRVNLSVKRLTADPFEKLMAEYPVDKKVNGTVAKVDDNGLTVTLDNEVEGLIRKEKIPLTTSYTVGQKITVTVSEFDKRRHKIILVPVLLEKPIGYR